MGWFEGLDCNAMRWMHQEMEMGAYHFGGNFRRLAEIGVVEDSLVSIVPFCDFGGKCCGGWDSMLLLAVEVGGADEKRGSDDCIADC